MIDTEKYVSLNFMENHDFKITVANPHPEDNPDSEKECEILMRWDDREHCWWSMSVINNDKSQLWKINAIANKLSELCDRFHRYSIEFINGILSFKIRII